MLINGKEIYYDYAIQKYVEIHTYNKPIQNSDKVVENLEINIVTKEHIKRELAQELRTNDKYEFNKMLKEKMATLYTLDIETRKIKFAPHLPKNWEEGGYKCLNLYAPTKLYDTIKKQTKNKQKTINNINFLDKYKHINTLISNLCNNKQKQKEYFINWLATALITLQKNGTAIIFKGIQGTGKGLLYEQIIQPIIGEKYTYTFSNNDLKSQFNKSLQNKLFVVGNEIKGDFREGNNIYETLKMWITDKELRIEQKGIDSYLTENYFNMLLFSNNDTPLQIQPNDRRYIVFNTADKKILDIAKNDFGYSGTAEFVAGIQQELEDFAVDLFCFDYNINQARIPLQTAEKVVISLASNKKSEIFAAELKAQNIDFFENNVAEYVELMETELFEQFCKKCNLIMENNNKLDTYNKFLKIAFDYLNNSGNIPNNLLTFLYMCATGDTQNAQKIGTTLTTLFGKSIVKKIEGNTIRVRKICEPLDTTNIPF